MTKFFLSDTSASETFDQTFESSLCTLDDDDECSPLAIKIKSESNLSKSISPLRLPPAKVNSPSQDSDLSQPVSQEPGKYIFNFFTFFFCNVLIILFFRTRRSSSCSCSYRTKFKKIQTAESVYL